MEESARRRMAWFLTVLVGIAYFFICAKPVPRELVFVPVWMNSLESLPVNPPKELGSETLLPFKIGSRFGYFSPDRGGLFAMPLQYGVALSPEAWASYERLPSSISFRSPSGSELFSSSEPGYPFMAAGRRFILGPGQASVAELGEQGQVLWQRDFSSVITAFDANAGLALFGLLDGGLVGLDPSGREILSFAPGGSRVAGIYGCAVSPDGLLAAAVSGLDKQRLVVLEKRKTAYRVTYHRWLESDFRRPVAMAFTEDSKNLLYEAPGGIGIYTREGRSESLLPVQAPSALGIALPRRDLLVALEGGKSPSLVCASERGRRIYSLSFTAKDASLVRAGESLFLGMEGETGEVIVRLDLKEE